MMFTTRMVYLTAVTMQEYSETVASRLLELGLMHFVDLTTVDPTLVARQPELFSDSSGSTDAVVTREKSAEARRRIEALLSFGNLPRPTISAKEVESSSAPSLKEAMKLADEIGARIDGIREQQRSIQQQINRLEDVERHLPVTEGSTQKVASLGQGGTFLDIQTGTIPLSRRESLEQKLSLFPAVLTPVTEREDRLFIVLVGMKRNSTELSEILTTHGFRAEKISAEVQSETRETLQGKLKKLREEQRKHAETIPALVHRERISLETSWRGMRVKELLSTINENFTRTRRVVVASGWLPGSDRQRVEDALTEVTEGHLFLEWHEDREFTGKRVEHDTAPAEAPNVTIPSRLQNPRFLQPFQTLVTNFGIPAYGTIDPTSIVAVAYLVMFALMFGDVGHGLVLVLAGLAGRLWLKRRSSGTADSGSDGGSSGGGIAAAIPLLSKLLLWCGGSAMAAGILFGSYFGFSWLPPVWFDYHGVVVGHVHAGPVESIFDILTITIYFGIAIIGIGLVVNWANLIRQRRWFPFFFDKTGILGGMMYGAGIILAAQFAASGFRSVPSNPILLGLIGGPAVVLFLKGPLEGHSRNPLWWLMEWVIELLEVFSGYLANTLSFMRVAGLGIAHVTLMIAFYQIAKMASPEGLNLVGIIILVLGNVLVIVLEGLSAGIQSLRLNYYEFFSKHFQPSGVAYKPVSLEVS